MRITIRCLTADTDKPSGYRRDRLEIERPRGYKSRVTVSMVLTDHGERSVTVDLDELRAALATFDGLGVSS